MVSPTAQCGVWAPAVPKLSPPAVPRAAVGQEEGARGDILGVRWVSGGLGAGIKLVLQHSVRCQRVPSLENNSGHCAMKPYSFAGGGDDTEIVWGGRRCPCTRKAPSLALHQFFRLLLLQVVGLTCYSSPEEPQESSRLLF